MGVLRADPRAPHDCSGQVLILRRLGEAEDHDSGMARGRGRRIGFSAQAGGALRGSLDDGQEVRSGVSEQGGAWPPVQCNCMAGMRPLLWGRMGVRRVLACAEGVLMMALVETWQFDLPGRRAHCCSSLGLPSSSSSACAPGCVSLLWDTAGV